MAELPGVPVKNPIYSSGHPERARTGLWKEIPEAWKRAGASNYSLTPDKAVPLGTAFVERSNLDMRSISRTYLDEAVEGHRQALTDLSEDNIEKVFMTSVVLSFYTLFTLNERENDALPSFSNVSCWLQMAKGTRFIGNQWQQMVGSIWRVQSGIFYGQPDLTDTCDLFNPEHSKPFNKLLTWAPAVDHTGPEHRSIYQQVLSYVCLIYRGIMDGSDDSLTTSK